MKEQAVTWFKNLERKKILKVGKIGAKDEILTVQEKKIGNIGNDKRRSLEMTPWKREVEVWWLRVDKMKIKKKPKKKNNHCQILVGKYVEVSYR